MIPTQTTQTALPTVPPEVQWTSGGAVLIFRDGVDNVTTRVILNKTQAWDLAATLERGLVGGE